MAETMFQGFDHTRYKDEITQCWGEYAHARPDDWWATMNVRIGRLGLSDSDWNEVAEASVMTGDSPGIQELAADQAGNLRLRAWISRNVRSQYTVRCQL